MGLATGLAIAGLAVSAAGTTKSFVEAGKARRDAKDASDKATKAFEEAEKKLEVNYLKGLSIQKEPYELAREAGISGAAQVLQAGREGELRGVASTAGRAQLLNQQQQNQIRMGMGQELQGLQRAAAAEESRLQGAKARLNLSEATGFQGMAADARARQQALNQAGAQGLVNIGTQAMKLPGLYGSSKPPATGEAGLLELYSDKGKMDTLSAISARLGDNPSFSDVFGSVSSSPVIPFDPNSVEVLEEDIIFEM